MYKPVGASPNQEALKGLSNENLRVDGSSLQITTNEQKDKNCSSVLEDSYRRVGGTTQPHRDRRGSQHFHKTPT